MKRYAFPKKFRLLKREDYLRVQGSEGRLGGRWVVLLYEPNDIGHIRVGITVSKKVGKAVVRNRVKRLIREGIRLSMPEIHALGVDVVVIARRGAASATFHSIRSDIVALLHRLSGRVRADG